MLYYTNKIPISCWWIRTGDPRGECVSHTQTDLLAYHFCEHIGRWVWMQQTGKIIMNARNSNAKSTKITPLSSLHVHFFSSKCRGHGVKGLNCRALFKNSIWIDPKGVFSDVSTCLMRRFDSFGRIWLKSPSIFQINLLDVESLFKTLKLRIQ